MISVVVVVVFVVFVVVVVVVVVVPKDGHITSQHNPSLLADLPLHQRDFFLHKLSFSFFRFIFRVFDDLLFFFSEFVL